MRRLQGRDEAKWYFAYPCLFNSILITLNDILEVSIRPVSLSVQVVLPTGQRIIQ